MKHRMSRMPRKKRGGSRGSSPEKGLSGMGDTTPPSAGGGGALAWADVVGHAAPATNSNQEQTFQHIQEMFKNKIDGDVIYMVLSECDWKVDDALEKLFMLSAENERSPQPSPLSMQSVAKVLGNSNLSPNSTQPQVSTNSISNPIPINAPQNSGVNLRLDTHSRLSSNHDQPATPEYLTMLSPKTPAGVSVEFPDLFMGSHCPVTGSGDSSAIQSAMEALGAYANNPTSMSYLPVYDASKDSYPNSGYDLGVSQGPMVRTMTQDPIYTTNLNGTSSGNVLYSQTGQSMAFNMGPRVPFVTTTSSSVVMNSQPGPDVQQNLFVPPDFGQGFLPTSNTDFTKAGYSLNFISDETSQLSTNCDQISGPLNTENQTPLPDLPHIMYNAQGMPVRKGHRKKTLSLDPAEREALETLIEDVIIGGVDEGVIDSDESTDSDHGENDARPPPSEPPRSAQQAADDTLSPEDQKKFLAGDAAIHQQGKKDGEGGQKRGKHEKGKDGGKVYPAQLKVAVKHMKSLPPRFLRRLQTAQKQLEANAKKGAENGDQPDPKPRSSDNRGWNTGNQGQPVQSPDGRDREKDRSRARGDHLKEKKKKIRNLLDDLDQYTDETTVVIEEKERDLSDIMENDSKSPGLNMSPQAVEVMQKLQTVSLSSATSQPKSPIILQPGANVVSCADLERELLQSKEMCGELAPALEPELKMSPMAQRMANLAASSQQNVMSLAAMAQESLEYSPSEKHTQFSVDAPEFVPKAFTPVGGYSVPPPPPPHSNPQFADMSGLPISTGVSVQSMGQPLPQGITPEQLRVIQQQAFLQKPSSPFQTPMGRMSPQMPPASVNSIGRLSPQIIAVSTAAQPQQLSPEQVAAVANMQGRNSPVPGSFMIPKVPNSMGGPVPIPPPLPGMGGMVPYPGYPLPPPAQPPPGNFHPRLPSGYPQQFPFRPPFVPPNNQGYGQWSTGDKIDRFPHTHLGPKPHFNRPPGVQKRGGHHGSPRMGGPKGRGGQKYGMEGQGLSQQAVSPEVAKMRVESLLKEGHKVMVILRGAPGSGKSTIAKEVQFDGVTLNTDDFFVGTNGLYQYDCSRIGEAHEWNQKRAKEACDQGKNPIIVDNTNTQAWEMKYYVSLAKMHNYRVEIMEPDTPWRYKAKELAKRNTHGVSIEAISKMLDRFEKNLTPERILATSNNIKDKVERTQAKNVLQEQQSQDPMANPTETLTETTANQTETKKPHRKRKRKRKRKGKGKEGEAEDQEDKEGRESKERDSDGEELETRQAVTEENVSVEIDPDSCSSEDDGSKEKTSPIPTKEAAKPVTTNKTEGETEVEVSVLEALGVLEALEEGSKENQTETLTNAGDKDEVLTHEEVKDKIGKEDTNKADKSLESELEDKENIPKDEEKPEVMQSVLKDSEQDVETGINLKTTSIIEAESSPVVKPLSVKVPVEPVKDSVPAFGSAEWRRSRRSSDVPRTISVTLADLREALLQELAECEGEESDGEGFSTQDAKNLEHVIQVIQGIKEDEDAEAQTSVVQMDTAEMETSYWSAASVDPYINTAVQKSMKTSDNACLVKSKTHTENKEAEEILEEGSSPLPKRERRRPEKKKGENEVSKDSQDMEADPWRLEDNADWTIEAVTSDKQMGTSEARTSVGPAKRLSPSKMLRARNQQPSPTLDNSVRQQLLSQSWALPQYISQPMQPSFFQIAVTAGNLSNFRNSDTQVTAEDLVLVQRIDQGVCIETYSAKVLLAHPRDIAIGYELPSDSRSIKITVDRSTSTEETEVGVDSLTFLKNCFPSVSQEDLKEILDNCKGNVEWAVNLVLDSGYEYNDPSPAQSTPKPQVLSRCIATPQVQSRGAANLFTGKVKSPSSLLDICHGLLEAKEDLSKKEVIETVTRTNIQRLRSIDEFKRSHNLSDCSDDALDSSGHSIPSLDISLDACVETSQPDSNSSIGQQAEAEVVVEDSWVEGGGVRKKTLPEMADQKAAEPCEDDLSLTLSPQLATQLIQMFGPVGFHISPDSLSGDDLNLVLNRKTARQLHRRWAQTLQAKFRMEEAAIQAMMKQDEELARRLQTEEELSGYTRLPAKSSGLSSLDSALPSPSRKPPVVGIQPGAVAVTVVHKCRSEPTSLRDIMQEEQAIENSRNDFLEFQAEASGQRDDISTQLKRQKLLDMFPSIDTAVLDEVYKAHGYSMEATVATLQGTHGPSQPTVTNLLSSECEQRMVERAMKESLASQWLGSAEDSYDHEAYQTYEDPEYKDFRAEASMHYRLRHECFQKAQEAYRRGMKSVASFYSQQGHVHTEKLQQANHRAASAIVQHKNVSLYEKNEVDLHGLHVDEAVEVLKTILVTRQAELLSKPDKRRQQLSVITGRGNHSRGGVARIRPALMDFLRRNGYNFSEPQPGLLRIILK